MSPTKADRIGGDCIGSFLCGRQFDPAAPCGVYFPPGQTTPTPIVSISFSGLGLVGASSPWSGLIPIVFGKIDTIVWVRGQNVSPEKRPSRGVLLPLERDLLGNVSGSHSFSLEKDTATSQFSYA
jgi:hypothetical protein